MRDRRMGLLALIVILGHLVGAATAQAQTGPAHVVKDINTARTSQSGSAPTGFLEYRGDAYFTAYTLETGRELWRSDGTEVGTVLVKDIQPGPLGSGPLGSVVAGDTLFFLADDGIHGWELWKSDGTEDGTGLVKDIRPGPDGSVPFNLSTALVEADGILFFVADDGVHGPELWTSDGTEAGTSLVKDLLPGPYGLATFQCASLGGALVFVADDGIHGTELWRSDGTESGTFLLADLQPGSASSYPRIIGRAGGLVYFTATYGPYYYQSILLKTDGSPLGTSFIKELTRLYASGGVEYAGQLYFTARNWFSQPELWRTDGSAEGTVLIRAFPVLPYGDVGGCYGFKEFQGDLYFLFQDGDSEHFELWKTQKAGAYVTHVKDLDPGGNGTWIYFVDLTVANGALIFHSYDEAHGYELWKSDGTEEGTGLLQDIRPGPTSSSPFNLAAIHGRVFFSASDGMHMSEPWTTDGTESGTAQLKDINAVTFTASSSPEPFVALGKDVFFTAQTNGTGRELWRSDGTEAGTHMVKDIRAGFSTSFPAALTVVDGTLFFTADDGVHGRELWKTDGTEEGTVLVKDIRPGPDSSGLGLLQEAYGALFFDADDGIHGHELWRSDGTEEGTVLVKDINPGPQSSFPLESPGDNPFLFFDADDGVHGYELWKSDGTEEGTVLVKDIVPGPESSYSGRAFQVNGTFLFDAVDGIHGRELWRTDGSEDGTFLAKDLFPGDFGSYPYGYTRVGNTLFFVATDDLSGQELWKSDGTEDGTVLVKNIEPGAEGSYAQKLTAVGDTLFFTAETYTDVFYSGEELWKSDGTEEGTVLVKDLTPEASSSPDDLVAVDGVLFFSAWDQNDERELWRSDGTEAGTVRTQDLAPGPFSSYPQGMTVAGSRLFFSAEDVVLGREPWAGRAAILARLPDRAMADLRGEVEGLGLPQGVEQSLIAKLRAAEAALSRRDGNPAAMRLLQAFIQQVEALSAGQITDTARANLLQFAQDIVDLLAGEVPVSPLPPEHGRPSKAGVREPGFEDTMFLNPRR